MEVARGGGATTVHWAMWYLVPMLGGAPGKAPLPPCLPGDGESPSCGLEVHGHMDIEGQSYSRAALPRTRQKGSEAGGPHSLRDWGRHGGAAASQVVVANTRRWVNQAGKGVPPGGNSLCKSAGLAVTSHTSL